MRIRDIKRGKERDRDRSEEILCISKDRKAKH